MSDDLTFLVTCDDCGGEGGHETAWIRRDGEYDGEWIGCPTCHGSGWIEEYAPLPEIEQDELPPALDGLDELAEGRA